MSFQNIKYGIYGGLAAGLVFGGLMGMMGTFPLIGQMVGVPSAAAGFFVYMVFSAIIGGSFLVLLDWAYQRRERVRSHWPRAEIHEVKPCR